MAHVPAGIRDSLNDVFLSNYPLAISLARTGGLSNRQNKYYMKISVYKKVADLDWGTWKAVDTATLLYLHDDSRVLLIHKKRGFGAGKVNAPGGKIEAGETAYECALREVREEVGIEVPHAVSRGELRFQFVSGYALHGYIFTAIEFRGEPIETPEAVPFWVSIDQIPYDRMWEDDRVWLPKVLAGESVYGRFIFDDDVMLDYVFDEGPPASP